MSQNYFVYGPLCDPELLGIVLGRSVEANEPVAARAMRRVIRLSVGGSPSLVMADGEAAAGALLREVSAVQADRFAFFFGESAQAEPVSVSAAGCGEVEAIAFSGVTADQSRDPWSPDQWAKKRRAFDIEFARDWMSQFGSRSVTAMEGLRASIGYRAHSRIMAAAETEARLGAPGPRAGLDRTGVEAVSVERPYMDFFSVEEHVLRHRKFDGSMTPELKRTVFFSGDAATILPYDPALDRVLLIEQWRAGPWSRGDSLPWCLEVVAGRVDPGEGPEATVIREAQEEADVKVTELQRIGGFYSTPGIAAEHLTAFIGRADLSNAGGRHGLDSEDEDIRVFTLSFAEAMELMDAEAIDNAPAIISLLWLAARRESLRDRWT